MFRKDVYMTWECRGFAPGMDTGSITLLRDGGSILSTPRTIAAKVSSKDIK